MDRDSFPAHKFDNAIKSAKSKNYHSAWSNECFELWILLHFRAVTHAMPRGDIYKALSKIFDFNYERDGKNKNTYLLIRKHNGSEACAINRAEKLWIDKNIVPSQANPVTGVFELVENLNRYLHV
jgi:hypothetical protein